MNVCRSMGSGFSHGLNLPVKLLAKQSGLAGSYAVAMLDIYGIRRANLLALSDGLKQRQAGLREQDVALALDLSPSHYSQMKGDKVMGDDVARKVEAARNLPHGWMDNVHDETSSHVREGSSPYRSQALRIDAETISAALKLVRLAFRQRDQEIDQEVNGEPLAYAYEFLLTRNETTATAENVIEFTRALNRKQAEVADETPTRIDRSVGGSRRQGDKGR